MIHAHMDYNFEQTRVTIRGDEESFINELCAILYAASDNIKKFNISLEAISVIMDNTNLMVEALKEAAPKAAKRSIKDLAKDIGDYYEKNHDNN